MSPSASPSSPAAPPTSPRADRRRLSRWTCAKPLPSAIFSRDWRAPGWRKSPCTATNTATASSLPARKRSLRSALPRGWSYCARRYPACPCRYWYPRTTTFPRRGCARRANWACGSAPAGLPAMAGRAWRISGAASAVARAGSPSRCAAGAGRPIAISSISIARRRSPPPLDLDAHELAARHLTARDLVSRGGVSRGPAGAGSRASASPTPPETLSALTTRRLLARFGGSQAPIALPQHYWRLLDASGKPNARHVRWLEWLAATVFSAPAAVEVVRYGD